MVTSRAPSTPRIVSTVKVTADPTRDWSGVVRHDPKGVLIISTRFAPSRQVGAKRFSFLAEVLRGKGLDVQVLTLAERADADCDSSLPVPESVHRTRLPLPFPVAGDTLLKKIYLRLLTLFAGTPDPYVSWLPTGLVAGFRIIRKHRIGAVIATAPPFTPLLMGALLARLTGARLIVDYRDPWLGHDWAETSRRRRRATVNRFLERTVLRQSSAIVLVTDAMRQSFERILGGCTDAPLRVIPNGFHPAEHVQPIRLDNNKINLVYAGYFYGERSLGLLAKPISDLIRGGEISKEALAIHVFGTILQKDHEILRAHSLGSLAHEHRQVDHSTMLRYLRGADILILFSGRDVSYALPFKLFDYLSVRRPILAVGPEQSAVADFMRHIPCGELGIIGDPDSIKTAIARILTNRKGYTFQGIEDFHWEVLGERYLQLIREVSRNHAE